MQGQRSAWGSFNDTVDLNQESLSSNTSMDHPTAWNNLLNPVDSRLSHNARSFSGWDLGESSSSANLQDPISGDGLKMEHGWPSSYSSCSPTETRLEERRFESSNNLFHDQVTNGLGGGQVMWGPPVNVNLNDRYAGNNDEGGLGIGTGIFPSFYKSGGLDSERVPSSGNVGTSSGNSGCFMESDDGSGSSLGNWGLSCKRKALEGTSAQPYPSGNISFFPQADNIIPHTTPAHHNSSRSMNLSSPAVDSPAVIRLEQPNPRLGHSMRGVTSNVFPPLNVTAPAEESTRNFGPRVNLNIGHPESVPFNSPSAGNAVRHSSSRSSHQSSRSVSFSDSFEFGPTASIPSNSSNHPSSLPHLMHGPGPGLTRNVPFHWNGALNSRTASSSSVGLREESSFRSTMRNNLEHPMFGPVSETRNLVQDPTNWSLATGSSTNSSSRAGPSSSSRNFPTAWLPHHNQPTQNHQPRLSDFAPWTLFPSGESEAGVSRGHFSPFASGPTSSPEETVMSSGGNNSQGHRQPYPRSAALLMELQGDDISGWRSLAADIDGRQRLVSEIRHVLNAMRRGENLRAEDYMLFDPFINGVAELHDRHRDMRLDVDNMSYEELLALEEQIGDVNTGLSEETILKSMKQRKYLTFMVRAHPSKIEPCCICQEEYVSGETIGTLDCGHDFHTNCVKQWLLQKNLCPICKMTALDT